MALQLVVREPFKGFSKGDVIRSDIEAIRAEFPAHVVAVQGPDEALVAEAPETAPETAPEPVSEPLPIEPEPAPEAAPPKPADT